MCANIRQSVDPIGLDGKSQTKLSY